MRPPASRLRELAELRADIFGWNWNETSTRSGAKYLRRSLVGPSMAQYYPPLLKLKPIRTVLRDSQRALLGLYPGDRALAEDGKSPVMSAETRQRSRNVKRLGATYEVSSRTWARPPDPDPEDLMTITDHAFEARAIKLERDRKTGRGTPRKADEPGARGGRKGKKRK